jgi:hypothetical protein
VHTFKKCASYSMLGFTKLLGSLLCILKRVVEQWALFGVWQTRFRQWWCAFHLLCVMVPVQLMPCQQRLFLAVKEHKGSCMLATCCFSA